MVIVFFILTGFVLLLTPKTFWPDFYDLPYMGWAALVCAALIAIAPAHYKTPLAVILLFNASGDLGLYELYRWHFQYDKVIHFLTPVICVFALAPRWGVWRTLAIVFGAAIAWELFEFLADTFIKTHLFGVYRHQVVNDTIWDLVMNVLGVTTATLYLRRRL